MLITKVASCELRVWRSSSASASTSSAATSRPVASLASSTSSQEGSLRQAAPMAGACEPWPG